MTDSMKIAAFGELLLRLAADKNGIAATRSFDACYGGTEANVLACMKSFGHNVKYVSALPDTELGEGAIAHLMSFGIEVSSVLRYGDGMGIYFIENGSASRGSNVVYMRKQSEFAKLSPNDVDCDKIFENVRLFHISGISFALSDSSRKTAFKLVEEAKLRGIPVSFDFNYRSKLWDIPTAMPYLRKAAAMADILLASTLDLTTFLDTTEKSFYDKYDSSVLIVRDRKILAPDRHCVKVAAYKKADGHIESYTSENVEFAVKEKIGGGDAFDGAILHKLLSDAPLKEAVDFAIAAFAFKATILGDTFIGNENDVNNFAKYIGE